MLQGVVTDCFRKSHAHHGHRPHRLHLLTHKVIAGLIIFAHLMLIVFQSVLRLVQRGR